MERSSRMMLILLYVVIVSAALCSADHQDATLRLELRRPVRRLGEILRNDVKRQKTISLRRLKRRPREVLETSENEKSRGGIEMELQPGRDYGTAEYLTELRVGTPSQKFTMIVDTGSELTWVSCRYPCGNDGDDKCRKRTRVNRRRVFNPHLSSSFRTVPCLSQTCKIDLMNLFSLTTCPTPLNPCAYDYRYLDGSAAKGVFAKETVTVGLTNGRKSRLRNVLVGCSQSFSGQSFNRIDGVIGLAYSKFSFVSTATQAFGGKFSYCLVDHLSHKNISNYLTFGNSQESHTTSLLAPKRHTKLELDLIPPFYALSLKSISIGDEFLDIPGETWDAKRGGGVILDSGTSLTFLVEPAYQPVIKTLDSYVKRFKRVKVDGIPMDHCFNSTGYKETVMPKLMFHMVDGARFEPHKKSYIIDVADGVKCLGFLSAGTSGSNIIGNIMQQNHFWEFNLAGSSLAFAPSTCA